MNPIQPAYTNGQEARRQQLAEIHRTLKNAVLALKLDPKLEVTASHLVNGIPKDAPHPTSPASVERLARDCRVKTNTIRNHIKRLAKAGLVENRCLGGGRRHCLKDRTGKTVEIYGISFAPMMARAGELADRADAIRAADDEHKRLRCDISCLRRGMSLLVNAFGDVDARAAWASLPRRLTELTLAELRRVIVVVKRLKTQLDMQKNGGERPKVSQDRPTNSGGQYTTEQNLSDTCNPAMPAENEQGCGQDSAQQDRPTCGLEHVTIDMILTIAPDDWRMAMDLHGRPSLHNLVGTAYQRAQEIDVSPSAWAQAQSALGPVGAAILVLLADAQSEERGGRVRSPGGWVRRMSERAETGTAHLHRTVFGLLHRKDSPCPSGA